MIVISRKEPVLIRVYYYLPDYIHLIEEFSWQTLDIHPTYPRVNKFLDYWRQNINAVIADIEMSRHA